MRACVLVDTASYARGSCQGSRMLPHLLLAAPPLTLLFVFAGLCWRTLAWLSPKTSATSLRRQQQPGTLCCSVLSWTPWSHLLTAAASSRTMPQSERRLQRGSSGHTRQAQLLCRLLHIQQLLSTTQCGVQAQARRVTASCCTRPCCCRLPLASRPELGDGGNMRPVVDLLVEQVECADFNLLNKVDLLPGGLEGEALEQLTAIVSSLNPLATVIACQDAKVRQRFGGECTVDNSYTRGNIDLSSRAAFNRDQLLCSTCLTQHPTCLVCRLQPGSAPPPHVNRCRWSRCLAAVCARWWHTSTSRGSTGEPWQRQRQRR